MGAISESFPSFQHDQVVPANGSIVVTNDSNIACVMPLHCAIPLFRPKGLVLCRYPRHETELAVQLKGTPSWGTLVPLKCRTGNLSGVVEFDEDPDIVRIVASVTT